MPPMEKSWKKTPSIEGQGGQGNRITSPLLLNNSRPGKDSNQGSQLDFQKFVDADCSDCTAAISPMASKRSS